MSFEPVLPLSGTPDKGPGFILGGPRGQTVLFRDRLAEWIGEAGLLRSSLFASRIAP